MTIGIGFLCKEGVVMCADRQLTATGYHKFQEQKLSHWSFQHFNMAFTYSGEQADGNAMARKVRDAFASYQGTAVVPLMSHPQKEGIRILEETFRDSYQNDYDEGFESLVGLCFDGMPPHLFKTKNSKVAAGSAEYIGGGDSSALRFVAELLIDGNRVPTVFEALVLGCYMVSIANRYVDGCSGGPDHVILRNDDKAIGSGMNGPFVNWQQRIGHCEEETGKALREILLAGGDRKIITESL